jgi:hypothetical protein
MIIASMVVGANGATSSAGSSAPLQTAIDRERFLLRRKNPEIQAILVGHRTTLVEPYNRSPHPLVIFSQRAIGAGSLERAFDDFIAKMRAEYPGKILCEGGITLIHLLLAANLIDIFYVSRVAFEGDDHFLDEELLLKRMRLVSKESYGDTSFERYERASR